MPSLPANTNLLGQTRALRFAATVLEVVLSALVAWLVARVIWFIAFGASPIPTELTIASDSPSASIERRMIDRNSLVNTPLFSSGVDRQAEATQAVAPPTQLDLELRGVRRGLGPDTGSAIIRTPDGQQLTLGVGQYVIDGVRLEAVFADRVTLRRNGLEESLFLREDRLIQPSNSQSTDAVTVQMIQDIGGPGVFEALEIIPEREGLTITGFRLGDGSDATILDQAGLQVGDLVTSVNGIDFSDPSDAFDVLEDLEFARRAVLTIERNGATQTIRVEMP